jgi:glucose-6-phosphate isomerase/transaldolase/glucose-6-phosphate isomerase
LGLPEEYGYDRLFVYLRMEGDDNKETDLTMGSLQAAGHPIVRIDMQDKYDVGAEFFRWEFATAVAGSVLKVTPFDQPDVQSAKDMTDAVLGRFLNTGSLPLVGPSGSLWELLDEANPGDYLAVMVYAVETPGVDRALQTLRRQGDAALHYRRHGRLRSPVPSLHRATAQGRAWLRPVFAAHGRPHSGS